MGLFDKIFGRGASASNAEASAQKKFADLRTKYGPALRFADEQGVRFTIYQLREGKLYFHAIAPSEDVKNRVWDQIKLIDPNYSDLSADIVVQSGAAAPGATNGNGAAANKSYTVKPGDSLSKISKEVYGDGDEYMRIFYANRDKIKDPDMIQIGQVLTIPPDTDK